MSRRIILTTIGLSLAEKMDALSELSEWMNDTRSTYHVLNSGMKRDIRNRISALAGNIQRGIVNVTAPEEVADLRRLRGARRAAADAVTDLLEDVWCSKLDPKFKRQKSPAEIASLSLLEPTLGPNDEVHLLYIGDSRECSLLCHHPRGVRKVEIYFVWRRLSPGRVADAGWRAD